MTTRTTLALTGVSLAGAATLLAAGTIPVTAAVTAPSTTQAAAHTTTATLALHNPGKRPLELMTMTGNNTITVDGYNPRRPSDVWVMPGKTTLLTIHVVDTNGNFGAANAQLNFFQTDPGTPASDTSPTVLGPAWAEIDINTNWQPTGQTELVRPGYESLSVHSTGWHMDNGTYTSNRTYVLFNGTKPLPDGALNIPTNPAATPITINTQ